MSQRHRAYEIPRDRMYQNFRAEPWNQPKRLPNHKTREGMSAAHLANVRALEVCLACCRRGPVDPHHLQHGVANRGFGLRSPDAQVVPLCRRCHGSLHALGSRREPEFFAEHGVVPPLDAHWVARRLWRNRASGEAMRVVVESHIAQRQTLT